MISHQDTGPCHMGSQDWQRVCKEEMGRVVSQYDKENNTFQWAVNYASEIGF